MKIKGRTLGIIVAVIILVIVLFFFRTEVLALMNSTTVPSTP